MSFLLSCPTCGSRPVDEFRFGGEIREPPENLSPETWRRYLYERANVRGPQYEWWYHRLGCKRWFTTTRDTRTNLETTHDSRVIIHNHHEEAPPDSSEASGESLSGAE
jgi:sarcosine oxidase subunit delta